MEDRVMKGCGRWREMESLRLCGCLGEGRNEIRKEQKEKEKEKKRKIDSKGKKGGMRPKVTK